jgi:uroporphyrinogen-III synthase
MKLLLTRPAADSAALAVLLKAQGHETVIAPMLEVQQHETTPPSLDGVTGLVFTSANGVRAFAALSAARDLQVYAVGDRTAAAARQAGFAQIQSADGDVEALVGLIAARRTPADGALLHVSGTVRAGNLAETLGARGFTVHHAALYGAIPTTTLGETSRAAIKDGSLDGVLLFSPRTAKHFAELVAAAALTDEARRLQAWCLSRAVAEALAPLSLAGIHVAAEPTQASLLAAIGTEKAVAVAPVGPAEPAPANPSPAVPTPPPAAVPVRHSGRSWAGVVALILLLGIGAAMTYQQWLPLVEPLWHKVLGTPTASTEAPPAPAPVPSAVVRAETPPAPTPPIPAAASAADEPDTGIAALAQRLDRLEAALDEVRVDAASAAPKGTVTALQTQSAEFGQQLDALAARPAADPQALQDLTTDTKRLTAALAQLNDRLTPLEARINQKAATIRNDRTLVLAAGQIRDALAGSGPFEAPVAVIRAVAPDDADLSGPLDVLAGHAKTGVPSRVRLAQELDVLPAKLAEPAPLAPDAGIWDRVSDKMGRLVTIRRVDDGSGNAAAPPGPDRLIANAGQALVAGDLAGAVQIMHGLDQAGAAKSWLDAAQARLDCEQAAQALEVAAIQRLSAPANGGAAE